MWTLEQLDPGRVGVLQEGREIAGAARSVFDRWDSVALRRTAQLLLKLLQNLGRQIFDKGDLFEGPTTEKVKWKSLLERDNLVNICSVNWEKKEQSDRPAWCLRRGGNFVFPG